MRFGFVVADNDYFFIVRQYSKDIKICLIEYYGRMCQKAHPLIMIRIVDRSACISK